jgi:hypothetical protein
MSGEISSMMTDGVPETPPANLVDSNVNTITKKDEEAPKRHYLEVDNLNKIPLWLAPCHLVAALFQGMQALFLFAFASQTDLQWLVYTNYPSATDEGLMEDEYAIPNPKLLGSYPITWYAGLFILLSCIDHISCILPRFRDHYEYYIQRHQSPVRWVEYSLSASLMRMHIAQVAGITDAHILFLIYAITHVALYFPALHEKLNAKARADGYEQNWTAFYCGTVPHMASWGVVFFYFFSGLNRGDPPGFVVAIVFSLFVLDMSFPICFVLQWKKIGIFQDYLVGEFGFIMLSFTTKTFLAWITLAGANGYSRN